jgi:hypothetical protein
MRRRILAIAVISIAVFSAPAAHASVIQTPPNNIGLVGYWSFNEGTSTIAHDFSGNGNNGTLSGSTLPAWTNGKLSKALQFDRNGSVNLGHNSSLDSSTFTVSFWIKQTSINFDGPGNAYSNIIMGRESYSTSGFRFGINNSGTLYFWTGQSGGTIGLTSSSSISVGTFAHVVLTYDGSVAKFYHWRPVNYRIASTG